MLLKALPRDLRANAVMKPDLDLRDPSMVNDTKFREHVLANCTTADPLAHLHSEEVRTAPGVSPYSIPAGVPLREMPVVANHPAIPHEETPAPSQPKDEIPIPKAGNSIDRKMDNMMKSFEAGTFQLSKANEPRYRGYQTAREYAIPTDHPPPHAQMRFSPPNAPKGLIYNRPGPNHKQ